MWPTSSGVRSPTWWSETETVSDNSRMPSAPSGCRAFGHLSRGKSNAERAGNRLNNGHKSPRHRSRKQRPVSPAKLPLICPMNGRRGKVLPPRGAANGHFRPAYRCSLNLRGQAFINAGHEFFVGPAVGMRCCAIPSRRRCTGVVRLKAPHLTLNEIGKEMGATKGSAFQGSPQPWLGRPFLYVLPEYPCCRHPLRFLFRQKN